MSLRAMAALLAASFVLAVASIRVSPGWQAVGYRERHYSGPTIEITQDIPNLRDVVGPCDHGFDDCLSSIRVVKR